MQQKMKQPVENIKVKEQLHAVELERDRAREELKEMRKMAQEANMRLSEALSAYKVEEVHSELNSINELLKNANQELKNKEEYIMSLEAEVGKAKDLELELAEKLEIAEANNKFLSTQSEEHIQELQWKLNEQETSEAQRKTLLPEREQKIQELELKLAENVETNEAQSKVLFCQIEERIRELEMEIDKRRTTETNILDLLITQTKQLELAKKLLEESKYEVNCLQRKLERWEEESVPSSELSASHLQDSHETSFSVRDVIENLRSELQLTKESLVQSQKKELLASSKVDILNEEIHGLIHKLKLTGKAEEIAKKATDHLAIVLKEVVAEASQLNEKLQISRGELEQSRAHEERLNAIIMINGEEFKMMLDEARTEAEKYKNTAARLKIEHEESVLAWNGKETGFIDCIRKGEEDRQATLKDNYRLHKLLLETDNKVILSKEENSKLRDILKHALNEANVAKKAAAIARLEISQLRDSLEEKEEDLNILIQENENYKVNEIAAHENIRELKRLLLENEKSPSKEVKKESKEEIPTKDLNELKEEFKDETTVKESMDGKSETPTRENSDYYSSPQMEKQDGIILGKVFSFSLRDLKVSRLHDDHVHDDDKDVMKINEALKDSIFEVLSGGSATHPRIMSSTFTDDGEPLHPEDF